MKQVNHSNLFLISALFLFACNSNQETLTENWDEFKVYYFDFDQAEHYSAHVSEDSLWSLSDVDSANSKTKRFEEVIAGNTPKTISDTLFLQELDEFGFEYQLVPESKHYELNDLFREKSADPSEMKWMCMPVYNDILVFKKENQIIGIAKICFGCNEIHVVGTAADTDRFGSCLGYQKLAKLLRR
jgi:hypothetical protein